jgi:hypothetical protein
MSPAMWCLGRPRLLWPVAFPADATGACIDGVIVHELAHVKRRDHLVAWIELAAAIVWWWNPLFWWVRAARREQAELSCDAWVISTLPDGRRAYAESLLALSGAAAALAPAPPVGVMGIRAGSRRALERRLIMIMKGRAALRLPLAGVLSLTIAAAATLPAWASASHQQPPPPPPPPPAAPILVTQDPPPPLPPPPAPVQRLQKPPAPAKRMVPPPPPPRLLSQRMKVTISPSDLPSDGLQLVEAFDTDRQAILTETERRLAERREAVIKALTDLQEQYTKAGKLDEAVAIRDYLRAGGPDLRHVRIDDRKVSVRKK